SHGAARRQGARHGPGHTRDQALVPRRPTQSPGGGAQDQQGRTLANRRFQRAGQQCGGITRPRGPPRTGADRAWHRAGLARLLALALGEAKSTGARGALVLKRAGAASYLNASKTKPTRDGAVEPNADGPALP